MIIKSIFWHQNPKTLRVILHRKGGNHHIIKLIIKNPKLDPSELTNYRPISNLPFMSNILEKVVSAQLCSFLQKKNKYIYIYIYIYITNFSQVLGPTISQKLHLQKVITNDLLLVSDQGRDGSIP